MGGPLKRDHLLFSVAVLRFDFHNFGLNKVFPPNNEMAESGRLPAERSEDRMATCRQAGASSAKALLQL